MSNEMIASITIGDAVAVVIAGVICVFVCTVFVALDKFGR